MEQREGGIWDSASPEGQTWIAAGLGAWTANGSLTSRAFTFVEAVVLRRVHLSLPQFVTTTSPSFLLPCLRPEFSWSLRAAAEGSGCAWIYKVLHNTR